MTLSSGRTGYSCFGLLLLLVGPLAMGSQAEPVDEGWLEAASVAIADAEYHVTWQEAWQAPNRAHNLRTFFTPEGIRVVPRTEPEPSWEFSLTLTAWGRPGTLAPIGAAGNLTADKNRIELDRGELIEWYVNGRDGLEQGFTIPDPPQSPEGDAPLVLDLTVDGNLQMHSSRDGQAIDFLTKEQEFAVRYDKLYVEDARGNALPSRFEVSTAGGVATLRLVIDDRDARYPIVVDPLMSGWQWSVDSDQANSYFGYSAGTAGDVNGDGYSDIVVGAYAYDNGGLNVGAAFVYHGSPTGPQYTPDWITYGGVVSANLGDSVATAGDVNGDGYSDLIVGAPWYTNGESGEGRAMVFHGSASGLSTVPDWTAELNQINAGFGTAVGSAGDVNGDGYSDVVVGAYTWDNGQTDEGGIFVYRGSASGLESTPWFQGELNQDSARFGEVVGPAGDVNGDGYSDVIASAVQYDNGQISEGIVVVYYGHYSGLTNTAPWMVESNLAVSNFGASAGTAGDVNGDGYSDVIVGAQLWDVGGQHDLGRVFVYHGSASGLVSTPLWFRDGEQTSSNFGGSVGTAGDINGDGFADVIIGARVYKDGAGDAIGRMYIHYGSPNGLEYSYETRDGDQVDAYFGDVTTTVGDINGDGYSDVLVGAYRHDNGETNEGRTFLFYGKPDGLETAAQTSFISTGTVVAGQAVAAAGDVNGDGYGDVIVTDPAYDNGSGIAGAVFVRHGSATGIGTTAAWTAVSDQVGAGLGGAAGPAGDVNGDGYADIVFSASAYNHAGVPGAGRVWIVHGSPTGLEPWDPSAWAAAGTQLSGFLGMAVGAAGDVNGDGFSDVFIGEPGWDESPNADVGAVHLYRGSATGLASTADWTYVGAVATADLGATADGAGDVNGDGFSDLIVGQPGGATGGRALVFHGSFGGLSTSPDWTVVCPIGSGSYDRFASEVASAGDVTGDGYSDVIVGGGNSVCNDAFVFYGSATGLSASLDWGYYGSTTGSDFASGDFNGDGLSDLAIGRPDDRKVSLWYGHISGLSLIGPNWTHTQGGGAGQEFGASVASGGDVNGDAIADLVVGSPGGNRAYVFESGGAIGRANPIRPMQTRYHDTSTPIGWLGAADDVNYFRAGALLFNPFGRGDVAMEFEVKPYGTPFDGVGTVTSGFADTFLGGYRQNLFAPPLPEETLYHWRARVLYERSSTPLQGHGPWFSMTWDARSAADVRTSSTHGAGAIAADDSGSQLQVEMTPGGNVRLSWGDSCLGTDDDYIVYTGIIGDFSNIFPCTCSTAGFSSFEYPPDPVDTFYIVVPADLHSETEGSYGADSSGAPRGPSEFACYSHVVEQTCP